MVRYLGFSALLFLSGCFNLPIQSTGTVTVLNSEARPATAKETSEEKAVSTYDPNSKVETTLQAPSGALAGAKITVPAGALAVAVDLVVEESIPMAETSVVTTLGIREDIDIKPVGSGMIIRPSQNVDLTRPLTLAMPINPVSGLKSWLRRTFLANDEHYAVFYKSMIEGELRAGVIPSSSLRKTEDGQIQFEGYFGAFWLCQVSVPIEEKIEAKTDEPTVNASRVAVIESAGIVSEDVIVTKASIPEVSWLNVSLSFDTNSRQGMLTASIGADRTLSSCQVDLRASTSATSGVTAEVSGSLNYAFDIARKDAHTLVGRFRCLDDQGRLTISDWSSTVDIPAEPEPAVAKSIVINGGSEITTSTQVELTLQATGATEMYITGTADCKSDGVWKAYSTTDSWTLTQTNAKVQVYAKFRNQLGKESECISSSILHDATPPITVTYFAINSGAIQTSSTSVSIYVYAQNAAEMYLTNVANCASGGTWSSYTSSRTWTLAQSNATATVYAKFRNALGTESACLSDTIIHDDLAPTAGSISINTGDSTTTSSAVTLTLSATQASEMYITNSTACAANGSWESYQSNKSWTLGQNSGTAIVYVKFRDMAGNESACISDSIDFVQPVVETSLQISGSNHHTCALLASGEVKCWGYNAFGQLGLGHTNHIGDGPNEMGSNLPSVNLGTGRTAKAITTGENFSCALLDNDTVKCWGSNEHGQLGLGNTTTRGVSPGEMGDALPTVNLGAGRTVKAISSRYLHSCAVLDNDTIKCWGHGAWGNLGNGNTFNVGDESNEMGDALQPVSLGTGRTVQSVSAGIHHTCAVLDNNTVKCWGNNGFGQLGIGSVEQKGDDISEMGDALPALALGTGRTATAVIAGYVHTCAILDTSALKCWGSNEYGELGQGNQIRYGDDAGEMGNSLPEINLGSGRTVLSVSAGVHLTCAQLDDSSVKCWGMNTFGQLGIGSSTHVGSQPSDMGNALQAVNLGTGRTSLAVGVAWHHACAVLDNEAFKCWGYNNFGQLGQGHVVNWGDEPSEMGDALPTISLFNFPTLGMRLWLKADSGLFQDAAGTIPAITNSDPIGLWQDLSGNGGHMTVAQQLNGVTARPALVTGALNGHAAVAFNGISNVSNTVSYAYPNTIFIVARYTVGASGRIISGLNNNWLMGWYNGGMDAFYAAEGWVSSPSGNPGYSWFVYATDQTASSQRLFRGLQTVTTTFLGGTSGPNGLSLGGWSACCPEYSNAEIAEVMVYDQVLSDAERTSVVNYLNLKYGTN